jgi:hypothetical protein
VERAKEPGRIGIRIHDALIVAPGRGQAFDGVDHLFDTWELRDRALGILRGALLVHLSRESDRVALDLEPRGAEDSEGSAAKRRLRGSTGRCKCLRRATGRHLIHHGLDTQPPHFRD